MYLSWVDMICVKQIHFQIVSCRAAKIFSWRSFFPLTIFVMFILPHVTTATRVPEFQSPLRASLKSDHVTDLVLWLDARAYKTPQKAPTIAAAARASPATSKAQSNKATRNKKHRTQLQPGYQRVVNVLIFDVVISALWQLSSCNYNCSSPTFDCWITSPIKAS